MAQSLERIADRLETLASKSSDTTQFSLKRIADALEVLAEYDAGGDEKFSLDRIAEALEHYTPASEPTGKISITENGTYDVKAKASAEVDVPTFVPVVRNAQTLDDITQKEIAALVGPGSGRGVVTTLTITVGSSPLQVPVAFGSQSVTSSIVEEETIYDAYATFCGNLNGDRLYLELHSVVYSNGSSPNTIELSKFYMNLADTEFTDYTEVTSLSDVTLFIYDIDE